MKSEKLQTKINKYFTIFTICIITTLSVIIGLCSSYKLQAETGENLADTARQISMQLDSDISERPVFIQGAKGDFIGDVHEALLLSDLLPNPANEPLRFVDISSPPFRPERGF